MKHIKTFESFLNEADVAAGMGPNAKKFTKNPKIDGGIFYFTDADEGGEDKLPEEWHTAVKNLSLKADIAVICFFDTVGDRNDVLNAAKLSGLTFAEVEGGDDGGSGGIVFSAKQ